MLKKEVYNIQNENLLNGLQKNAKEELIKYNLLDDLINYKYTILLDSVDTFASKLLVILYVYC